MTSVNEAVTPGGQGALTTTHAAAHGSMGGMSGRRAGLIVTALVVATFAEGIIVGLVPVTVSGIGQLFGTSAGELTWVNTTQLLAAAVSTPIFSRLGDMYGHRRLLRVAVLLCLVGAIACAAAPNFSVVIVGRALEGPMAAFTALSLGILRDRLPARRQRLGMSSIVAGLTGGIAVGLVVAASAYSGTGSVRGVLWIPAAFLAVALALVITAVPETSHRAHSRVDWTGGLLLSASLVLVLLVLAEGDTWGWSSFATVASLIIGVALFAAWVLVELHLDQPMIDLRTAARRINAPLYLAGVTMGVAFFGAQTANVTFMASPHDKLGYGFDLNITKIAYAEVPYALVAVVGSIAVARLVSLWNHKVTLYIGCAAMAVGYLLTIAFRDNLGLFIVAMCVTGFGGGVANSGMPLALAERAQRTATGVAAGLFNTVKSIGGSIGGAIFASLLTAIAISGTDIPREAAYVAVWGACGAAALISLLIIAAPIGHTTTVDGTGATAH